MRSCGRRDPGLLPPGTGFLAGPSLPPDRSARTRSPRQRAARRAAPCACPHRPRSDSAQRAPSGHPAARRRRGQEAAAAAHIPAVPPFISAAPLPVDAAVADREPPKDQASTIAKVDRPLCARRAEASVNRRRRAAARAASASRANRNRAAVHRVRRRSAHRRELGGAAQLARVAPHARNPEQLTIELEGPPGLGGRHLEDLCGSSTVPPPTAATTCETNRFGGRSASSPQVVKKPPAGSGRQLGRLSRLARWADRDSHVSSTTRGQLLRATRPPRRPAHRPRVAQFGGPLGGDQQARRRRSSGPCSRRRERVVERLGSAAVTAAARPRPEQSACSGPSA